MTEQPSSVLAEINALSNERQRLYGLQWTRRTAPGYRDRIKSIDAKLADLWQVRRRELLQPVSAAEMRYIPVERGDFRSRVESTAARNISSSNIDAQPVTDIADALADVGRDVAREALAELRSEDALAKLLVEALREVTAEIRDEDAGRFDIPLKTILARRRKTLAWTDKGSGRMHCYEVALQPAS